jgi:hypothetical protein
LLTEDGSGRNEIIGEGGKFGEEQLLADGAWGEEIDENTPSTFVSDYTAVVLEDCVCEILTLKDCREVFDTSFCGDSFGAAPTMIARKSGHGSFAIRAFQDRRSTMRTSIQQSVKLNDLSRKSVLGEGQFGSVWLVSAEPDLLQGEQDFALKIQSKGDLNRQNDPVESIQREMDIMTKLNHPFIADLIHSYEDDENMYMLMGVVVGCELWEIIHKEDEETGDWISGISEESAKFYALCIADALAYIHGQKYIWRDLKPENVMVGSDGYPVLCDFGLCKFVDRKLQMIYSLATTR